MKLGLLLLKTTPITNQGQSHAATCNLFYGHTLKVHLPIYQSIRAENTCTLDVKKGAQNDIPSKYQEGQEV